jgi:hypothetical protein
MEDWKTIEDFPEYEVSSLGRVRRGEFILSPSPNSEGYLRMNLYNKGRKANKRVHRLVAAAFLPSIEGKVTVDHINRKKDDNRLENLRWANNQEQSINKERKPLGHIRIQGKRYVVRISRDYQIIYRESFETLEEAIKARDEAISLNQSYTDE